MKKSAGVFLGAFLPLIWLLPVQAQYEMVPGYHEHDGFYLRFQFGYGSGKMVEKELPGGDMTLSGPAGAFRFQIGSSIAENLVLFGEMGGGVVSNPQMEWGENSHDLGNTRLSIMDFGAGLTYYFMPSNIYICGSITLSKNQFEHDNITAETKNGAGACLSAGREWWVGADWGLGLAGFFSFSNPSDVDNENNREYPITNTVFGIMFSATYQ